MHTQTPTYSLLPRDVRLVHSDDERNRMYIEFVSGTNITIAVGKNGKLVAYKMSLEAGNVKDVLTDIRNRINTLS